MLKMDGKMQKLIILGKEFFFFNCKSSIIVYKIRSNK